jgi:membrane fusion protein, multidrug efflux system
MQKIITFFKKRFNLAQLLAVNLLIIAFLWIISGQFREVKIQDDRPDLAKKGSFKVVTNLSRAESVQKTETIYGKAEVRREVILKSEVTGKIAEILFNEGDEIKINDVIIKLDKRQLQASFNKAKSELKNAKLNYQAQARLLKKNLSSKSQYSKIKSLYQAAKSNYKLAEVKFENSEIKAPFNGVIEEIFIEEGEVIKSYDTNLVKLIDDYTIRIIGHVPEAIINNFHLNSEAEVILSGDIKTTGELIFIANSADNNTKSYNIEVLVDNKDGLIRDGMSAEIIIPTYQEMAHYIKPAALVLGDNGKVGIKHLNKNREVLFAEVEILEEEKDYILVTGLPDEIELIVVGQGFVTKGQIVDAELKR